MLQVAEPFNVRSGPGLDFPVLTTLAASQYYVLTGRNADASWLHIRLADGSTGWITNAASTVGLDLANLPVATAAPALAASPSLTTTEPVSGVGGLAVGTANPSVLYVRSGPGLNYTFVDTLAQNQAVTLEGRTADGSWLQVRLPNDELGWVSSAFMTVNLAIADLPVVEPTAPAIVALPSATSPAPGVGGQALGAVVNATNLNVRTGPGLTFSTIGMVPLGTSLVLEGRDASGLWLQVRLADGTLGWVSRTFMEPNLDIANLPVTD
ncbi:MAG TPA: SH3 domain-containing protein [Caldilineaceae bacterium]|nr:SH3 domain-containing protein [Caldilineaceae bacterium]